MPYLYAVRMLIPNTDPQPIKVGFTTDPDRRRHAYNSGPYPCEWLGVWRGSLKDEWDFHARFGELNEGMTGEWFLPNEEFIRVVTAKIIKHRSVSDYKWLMQQMRERRAANAAA